MHAFIITLSLPSDTRTFTFTRGGHNFSIEIVRVEGVKSHPHLGFVAGLAKWSLSVSCDNPIFSLNLAFKVNDNQVQSSFDGKPGDILVIRMQVWEMVHINENI